jgi:hypothetical protein
MKRIGKITNYTPLMRGIWPTVEALAMKNAVLNDVNTKIQKGKLPEGEDDFFNVKDRQFVDFKQTTSVPVRVCDLNSIIDMDKVFLARRGANTRTDLVTSISNVKEVEMTVRIYVEYIIDAATKGVKVLKAYPIAMDKVIPLDEDKFINPGIDGGDDYVALKDEDNARPYEEAKGIMIGRGKVVIISEDLMKDPGYIKVPLIGERDENNCQLTMEVPEKYAGLYPKAPARVLPGREEKPTINTLEEMRRMGLVNC